MNLKGLGLVIGGYVVGVFNALSVEHHWTWWGNVATFLAMMALGVWSSSYRPKGTNPSATSARSLVLKGPNDRSSKDPRRSAVH